MKKYHERVKSFNEIITSELPWAVDLGITCVEMKKEKAKLLLKFNKKMLRPGATISGPTMMALADATMYAVVLNSIGIIKLALTTSFNINFLAKPEADNLIADGAVLKKGKRLVVTEVKIYSTTQEILVAHATGTYSIPPINLNK